MTFPLILVNPLPYTLRHFIKELEFTLGDLPTGDLLVLESRGEGLGAWRKLLYVLREIPWRVWFGLRNRGRTLVVVWPIFGNWEPVTWLLASWRNRVVIILHDPIPLRKAFGSGRLSRFALRVCQRRVSFVTLSTAAKEEALAYAGVRATTLPHPLLVPEHDQSRPARNGLPLVVRVLGQNKLTRNLEALELIPYNAKIDAQYELCGRGWPDMAGWHRIAGFVPEEEFDELISSASVILVPYSRFYQSGVAVRALEQGVPIVAESHEHLLMLYGEDWPGFGVPADWPHCIRVVLEHPHFCDLLGERLKTVAREAQGQWGEYIRG